VICPICGSNKWTFIRRHLKPDIYESFAGIKPPKCRAWWKCRDCGLYKQSHSYDTQLFNKVYEEDYRAKDFRGESIKQVFDKVISLPHDKSENIPRAIWFSNHVDGSSLLDVGSGFGVFPYEIRKITGIDISIVEPNKEASDFINNELNMFCHNAFYDPTAWAIKFDIITCIHVLEHMQDPEEMLHQFHQSLTPDGKIFIEVPDAKEFDYLPPDHDEFNSTHIHFFSPDNLYRLVECCDYTVTDMHMVRTNERDLSRIMLVAQQ